MIASFAAEGEDFPSIPAYESGWPDFSVINDTFETTSGMWRFHAIYLPDFNPDRICRCSLGILTPNGDDDLAKLYKDIPGLGPPTCDYNAPDCYDPFTIVEDDTLEMNTPGGSFSLPWISTLTEVLLVT